MFAFLIGFAVFAGAVRIALLALSIRNEFRLKRDGAIEHGRRVTVALTLAHVGYYVAAIVEGLSHPGEFTVLTLLGLVLYTFAMAALVWVVRTLGPLWTIKLMIARHHRLVDDPVFRALRHPNYFLNIPPELIGLALVLGAYQTLAFGLPFYALVLAVRIFQEESTMRRLVPGY